MQRLYRQRLTTPYHTRGCFSLIQAPPKEIPKTIETCRIPDETIVLPDDEETLQDEKTDEFSAYFDRRVTPKILITSVDKPSLKSHLFMRELCKCIPNSDARLRRGTELKKAVVQATERGYTDILVVNEDRKIPNGLLIVHLPDGPTAHFKVSSFKRGYDIKVRCVCVFVTCLYYGECLSILVLLCISTCHTFSKLSRRLSRSCTIFHTHSHVYYISHLHLLSLAWAYISIVKTWIFRTLQCSN